MQGKAKRARILLPKQNIRASSTSPSTDSTNHILAKTDATRNKLIFSSTLQACPVIPPNEIRLEFNSEFSTIRENSGNVSEREVPTKDDVDSSLKSDTIFKVEAPQLANYSLLPKSSTGKNQTSVRNCKLVQDHTSGGDNCSSSEAHEMTQIQDGFNVPDLIGFSCEESVTTILNPREHRETNDSSESDDQDLQFESEALEESVVLTAENSSAPAPNSKIRKTDMDPFCSNLHASITTEPSHMSFNQDKGGQTLRPRKTLVSISKETEEYSPMKSNLDSEDADYSASDSESSDDEFEPMIQKCVWMETHSLCRVVCNSVNDEPGSKKNQKRTARQGKATHVCPTCNKKFGRKGHLNTHEQTVHERKKPYACSICSKNFGLKKSLDRHILTVHEKKKPFACPECSKSFGEKGHLMTHLRTHTGSKPFSCNFCSSAFTQSGSLTIHVRIHTKEKPFKCSSCSKEFSDKYSCRKHEKIHHL